MGLESGMTGDLFGGSAAGRQQRDEGMRVAIEHAVDVLADWKDRAEQCMRSYLACAPANFSTEDIRAYAKASGLPDPPSLRAWGPVIRVAQTRGLIRSIGTIKVRNPRAHCANAALWTVNRVN